MKFSPFSLVTFLGLCHLHEAACQSLDGLPPCGKTCVLQLLNSHKCPAADVKCICSNKTLIANASCCIFKNCDGPDSEKASHVADRICGLAGVTTLPQKASCSSTTAPSGQTSSPAEHNSNNDGAKAIGLPSVGAMCALGGAAIGIAGFLL